MQRRVFHWLAGFICTVATSLNAVGCTIDPGQACFDDPNCTAADIAPVQAVVLKQVAIF